jgi:hypothetical protein
VIGHSAAAMMRAVPRHGHTQRAAVQYVVAAMAVANSGQGSTSHSAAGNCNLNENICSLHESCRYLYLINQVQPLLGAHTKG